MPKLSSKICAYIDAHYLEQSSNAMARRWGCSSSAVRRYMRERSLVVPKELVLQFRAQAMKGKTTFTPEEDICIRENYLVKPIKTLAQEMKRSYTGIMARLRALNLIIPEHVIEERKLIGRKKKGDIPPNKGKKQSEYMTPEAIAKTMGTRFKKGSIPHNAYNEPGKISIRKQSEAKGGREYKYICLELGNWKQLHVHNWEQVNGPIPRGHCLWFKDRNCLNTDLSNLELITKKENRLRNSSSVLLSDRYVANCIAWGDPDLKEEIINHHPDLLELKRHQIKLNRAINEAI